ncbi:MAG: RluA family pseudouridine synthase [Lachnospiraceae bacterium]|nr:RluA family pseudouridine synthase [Lachnospiraceae bacterium]
MINKELKILMEDSSLIAVRKPAGIASESGRIGEADMLSLVRNYLAKKGETPYAAMIMRLDQPVEGILLFAKNKKSAALLSSMLQKAEIVKTYTALVKNGSDIEDGEHRLTDYLIRVKGSNISKVASEKEKNSKDAKKAELIYKKIGEDSNGNSLLSVKLLTGRHHQIRLQLSNAGMPIVGDRKYGGDQGDYRGPLCLACSRLELLHPKNHEKVLLEISPDFASS